MAQARTKRHDLAFLAEVVREFTPTAEETHALKAVIREVISALEEELRRQRLSAEVMLGGSAAKGTFLKHDFDCDCFVRFDGWHAQDDLSALLAVALRIFPDVERLPGSRDYFKMVHKGVEFEIVPVLRIRAAHEVKNVTDASPLHVGWILRHLERKPELRHDILLTKLFLKANDLYGAESYIRGFSGHIVDLLVIHYGSFLGLLRAAAGWKEPTIIDVEGHHKDALSAINKSKHGPLMLVDPVQPERNAAAALSRENFLRLREVAREFIEKPTKEMFRRKELTKSDLLAKAGGRKLILMEAVPHEGKHDVMGARMLKVFEFFTHSLLDAGFSVEDAGWRFTPKRGGEPHALLWFILPKKALSHSFEREGPLALDEEHARRFRESHRHVSHKGKRLCALVKRKHRRPEALVRALLDEKHPYIDERASRITLAVRTP